MNERPQDSDAEYLRSMARGLSYNASKGESVRKHRLNEIATRIQTGYYQRQNAEAAAQDATQMQRQDHPSAHQEGGINTKDEG